MSVSRTSDVLLAPYTAVYCKRTGSERAYTLETIKPTSVLILLPAKHYRHGTCDELRMA